MGDETQGSERKRARRYYNVLTFLDPADQDCPVQMNGRFQDNMKKFLEEFGCFENYKVEGMPVWTIFLGHDSSMQLVPLYIIQVDVKIQENVKVSAGPLCDHCISAGWIHPFVCKKDYHFIVPADQHYRAEDGIFKMKSHLLHGLIHCNGFGHLIGINGIQGGSSNLCGVDLMSLWDRICDSLLVRKVSVLDLSRKHTMELRLPYGIAKGYPWFGRWGYKFCNGNTGATQEIYESAIVTTSSMTLDQIVKNFSTNIRKTIEHYRRLSDISTRVVTLRDLFGFMLSLNSTQQVASSKPYSRTDFHGKYRGKDDYSKCQKIDDFSTTVGNQSRWAIRRIEETARVIATVLKEKRAQDGTCVMSRPEARDAARIRIGDIGLIDHVLASIDNVEFEDCIIFKVKKSRTTGFSIKELKNGSQVDLEPSSSVNHVPGRDVLDDISYLYTNLLLKYPDTNPMNLAVKILLDTNKFVKEWALRYQDEFPLRILCRLMPHSQLEKEDSEHNRSYVEEYVDLPLLATKGKLKMEVERVVRETYWNMENIKVEISQMEEKEDAEVVLNAHLDAVLDDIDNATGARVVVSVRVHGLDQGLDHATDSEGGPNIFSVSCICGTQVNDGNSIVCCDKCGRLQHSRCNGLETVCCPHE